MGKAPAVIIVARHGARLDQADKQWHLTSPVPYDPPLTYGGWTQARALGARIGGILRAREEEQEDGRGNSAQDNGAEHTRRKRTRKHKVIIHSSPFTRCVQTSIAIGAGIAQVRGRAPSVARHHVMHSGSPHIQAMDNSPQLSAISEPAEDLPPAPSLPNSSAPLSKPESNEAATSTPAITDQPKKHPVAELRIDAFLGEWLSPDYFENITPPPSSVMMVASAKADLLRLGETIDKANPGTPAHGHFPGGWSIDSSGASSADYSEEKTGLANMAALGHALSNRTRSSTHGSDSSSSYTSRRHAARFQNSLATSNSDSDVAYVPPTPSYAISPSDPIPVGYVAHARDACISVAYQWDSMRAPQCWGGGGEYGEEWSSMHRRFRNGLAKMIEWYEEHGKATNTTAEMFVDPVEEEETDLVLILVTHGAGCNALLGALTNQPVLLDVGMASLTMAVRKEGAKGMQQRRSESEDAAKHSPQRKNGRRGSVDLGIAEDYKMKFTASTEHLRAGSNPLATGAISPRIGSSGSNSPYRRPTSSFSGDSFTIGDVSGSSTFSTGPSRTMTAGGAFGGGLYRSGSGPSTLRSMYPSYTASSVPKLSSGLWRSGNETSLGNDNEGRTSVEIDSLPNFGNTNAAVGNADRGSHANQGLGLRDVSTKVGSDIKPDFGPDVRVEQQERWKPAQQPTPQPTPPPPSQLVNGNANTNPSSVAVNSYDWLKSPSSGTPTPTSTRTASPMLGLWGGGGSFARDKDAISPYSPKRRWTVVENTAG